ncbi:MAG: DUF4093 domain-containing protein [Oscillospiraceae bacterium]|nr:DUF4093 domain-containing protein [Oscillospiraceae bacterium]
MKIEKIFVKQAVVVEGKYDKIKLDSLIDGLIIPTHGFHLFRDRELREFLRGLAKSRGLIVLTDSDAAGFKIRAYLGGMVPSGQITNVFIPDVYGKERRKDAHSAEGKLGVEGMDTETLRKAFAAAGIAEEKPREQGEPITRMDLYEDGLMGGENSRALRFALYDRLSLPRRINLTSALPLINNLLTKEEYKEIIGEIRRGSGEVQP